MVVVCQVSQLFGFLYQGYGYRSIATENIHEAGLAPVQLAGDESGTTVSKTGALSLRYGGISKEWWVKLDFYPKLLAHFNKYHLVGFLSVSLTSIQEASTSNRRALTIN